jgi:uncharacterized membrane protein YdjX (TVP38/TMEM64 family)
MQPDAPVPTKKLPLLQLGILAAVVAVVGVLVLKGLDYRILVQRGLEVIRSTGPVTFLLATAFLPAFGAPLSVFTLTAGELFAPLMTMPGIIVAMLIAIAVNLAFTYWLARFALRPVLAKLIRRYGYSIPSVTPANALSIALTIRLTPGPPFALQSYMLGLAEVPFRVYMIVSWLCILPWAVGATVVGKGVFNGNFMLVSYGIGVIAVATFAVNLIRKKYVKRPG